jgi:predicted helicase
LKIDFPRLPLTTDRELFRGLCALGTELVELHLLDERNANFSSPIQNAEDVRTEVRVPLVGTNPTVAAGYPKKELFDVDENGKGRVYINKSTYFDGVPESVFNFHIGGYQVCHKWLKDRKDRELSEEDINHYGKITVALGETIRLMAEIDAQIEEHGGFPLVGSQT